MLEWKQEDRRYGSGVHRYLSERDESKLQHCTHVISQLDEKTVFEREKKAGACFETEYNAYKNDRLM